MNSDTLMLGQVVNIDQELIEYAYDNDLADIGGLNFTQIHVLESKEVALTTDQGHLVILAENFKVSQVHSSNVRSLKVGVFSFDLKYALLTLTVEGNLIMQTI